MPKAKRIPSVYGPRYIIEGYRQFHCLYVNRTNLKTYVVSTSQHATLESMVEIAGEYHFNTLKQLNEALNAV